MMIVHSRLWHSRATVGDVRRCKSTPTRKTKLTSNFGPTVLRSVTEIPFQVFMW